MRTRSTTLHSLVAVVLGSSALALCHSPAWAQTAPSPTPADSAPAPIAPAPITPAPVPAGGTLAPAPSLPDATPTPVPVVGDEGAPPPPVEAGVTAPAKREPPAEDDGVGFKWVWLVPELGFSYVNLKSFSETNLAVVDSSKSGAMAGVGAGVRIVFLTLGVRARRHFAMEMWQVMGEAALHLKVNRVDPYIAFRGGYDTIGSSFGQAVGNATGDVKVDVKGFNVGAALGFDYFVANNVTLGIEGSGDFLFLTRPLPPLPAGVTPAQKAVIEQNPLYKQSGSSVGFGGVLAARLGFHF